MVDNIGNNETAAHRSGPPPASIVNAESIEGLVRAEVQRQLDRERVLLKDVASLAVKIVGGAFALLLAMFTIFGITTWKDVKNDASDYVKGKVDDLVLKADSETGVKQYLNELVNHAIVSSALISIKRGDEKNFELPTNEWRRLTAWLKDENLELQSFTDVLAILNRQNESRKKADANGFLSEMLNPPSNSKYEWIIKQPDKRLAIMTSFDQVDMGSSAIQVAGSAGTSKNLRVAAIQYAGKLGFREGFDRLLALAQQSSEGDLRREAMLACARLDPLNAALRKEIASLLKAPARGESIDIATGIFAELGSAKNQQKWPSGTSHDEVVKLGEELLVFAINGGAYFAVQMEDPFMRLNADDDRSPARISPQVILWVPDASGVRGRKLGSLKSFGEFKSYWSLLEDAANAGDLSRVRTLLPRPDRFSFRPPPSALAVQITLGVSSKVVAATPSGEKVSLAKDDISSLSLRLAERSDSKDITVNWTNSAGKSISGTLVALSGGGFSVSPGILSGS